MSDILSVGSMPIRDDNIIQKQCHSYAPYTSSFENSDEIRIAIQSQDLYVLPSESYICLDIQVSRKTGASHAAVVGVWSSNYAPFLFSEIRYELNGIEIDRTKNVGMTSNIKRFSARTKIVTSNINDVFNDGTLQEKTYSVIIPLNLLLGFCDDY